MTALKKSKAGPLKRTTIKERNGKFFFVMAKQKLILHLRVSKKKKEESLLTNVWLLAFNDEQLIECDFFNQLAKELAKDL
jgi:hypothetical protein